MMKLSLSKYHGAGNDFILIDNRASRWLPDTKDVALLCDRHFGIGADGLILLTDEQGFDFGMTYFNSDGNESTMCGNGGRCITAFAAKICLIEISALFKTFDGAHQAEILEKKNGEFQIRLKMNDVQQIGVNPNHFTMNTGSPHHVLFVEDAKVIDVFTEGRKIRSESRYQPDGINVDFVEDKGDRLYVRTYERGVENETLSCGTGVTASVLAYAFSRQISSGTTQVITPGGGLSVSFQRKEEGFTDIWLTGPARLVFEGEIEI